VFVPAQAVPVVIKLQHELNLYNRQQQLKRGSQDSEESSSGSVYCTSEGSSATGSAASGDSVRIFAACILVWLLICCYFRTRKLTMSRQATAWNRITSQMSIVRAQEQIRLPHSGERMVIFLDAFFNVLPKFSINHDLIISDRERD
jgi:hypothetical protein